MPAVNDVVLSRRCNPGETAFVPPGQEFALGQNLVLLRADGVKVYPPFLRWLVQGPEWWEQIGKFLNVGAVFDSLRCADVPNFKLRIPPIPDQRAIVHILGTLDDKIELNRRMNETLEAMARALFKSWFVDFDPVRAKAEGRNTGLPKHLASLFPDSFEETQLGRLPEGWHYSKLRDVTTKIGSGATPRGGNSVYIADGVALIRSQNVYDSLFVWDGLACITDTAAEALRGVTVKHQDILLNITGASILRTCVVDPDVLPARVNQHVCIIRPKSEIPVRYIHFNLLEPSTKVFLMGMDAGASRQAVTKGHIEAVPLVIPTEAVLNKFASLVDPLFEATHNNKSQSRSLADIRDCLLPKLISGDLRVKEAEKIAETVA
jgi:type I restriction enzyme S subunit